ncbi:MAG: sugar phosphate isomerase/epimerase family protein [Cyclobacteriaceae bacterium]
MRKLLLLFSLCLHISVQAQQDLDNPFFVFNNGVKDEQYDTVEEQIQLLTRNGYDGMEKNGLDNFEEVYLALQANDLKLYTIYVNINLDNPEQPYDPRLKEVFQMIEGSGAMPWLYVTSKKYPPSSSEYDTLAVPLLQQIADMAQQYGIKVMLYPHMNFWIESVEDAIRVAEKVDRRNFGMTFNLCHYLAHKNQAGVDPWAELQPLSEQAMPYLFAISLNGADARDADQQDIWTSFIQPLGEGNFDTYRFLKTFLDQGFEGPVGLQCYSIDEDKAVHLRKSMQTWQEYQRRYAAEN